MAGYNFTRPNRDQLFLMPPALQDWLPADDLAYFLLDAVDQFDLAPFDTAYRADGVGQAAFQPHMMVALLLYAYCLGVRSRRQIERLCQRDVAFRVVAGNLRPDHATIARFRQRHTEALKGLFTEILRLCREAGLVKVGVVVLDGTKMAADAALDANRTYESIRSEVETMLQQAEATDAEEDWLVGPEHRGDELPEAMRDRSGRLERLKRCRERLEAEAAEAAAEHARELAERAAKEAEAGQKLRGRKPKPVAESPEAEANVTDPDSRIMKTRRGYVQGYNAQAAATADQILVAAEMTPEENDVDQLRPMLAATATELQAARVDETVGAELEIGPDGELYVVDTAGAVRRYDPVTGEYLGAITGGLSGAQHMAFSATGELFVDSGATQISRSDLASGNLLNVISPPRLVGPFGLAFTPASVPGPPRSP